MGGSAVQRALEDVLQRANMIDKVKEDSMPDHIRLIIRHGFIGLGISVAFTAMILAFNVGNLWHLVTHTAEGPVAVLMLLVFGTITFGSAQIGYKIMSLSEENDGNDQGGKRDTLPVLDPAAVPAPVDHR